MPQLIRSPFMCVRDVVGEQLRPLVKYFIRACASVGQSQDVRVPVYFIFRVCRLNPVNVHAQPTYVPSSQRVLDGLRTKAMSMDQPMHRATDLHIAETGHSVSASAITQARHLLIQALAAGIVDQEYTTLAHCKLLVPAHVHIRALLNEVRHSNTAVSWLQWT